MKKEGLGSIRRIIWSFLSFDHTYYLRSSRYLSVRRRAAIGRDFVLLVLYSILHNSRRLASYLLYAGPSTSCFLQGVREQREGEAKGKLKRSARIYSRPDRGQKGEPCRPFSSRREHAKHITSWQGKWNKVKKEISIHHVVLIIKPWMWFIAQWCIA